MTADDNDEMTLVLCGTGTTGSRVAARLADHDVRVRVGSRSGRPPFDWADRVTWSPALEGVGSVYVVYYPDFVVSGAIEAVGRFAELAVAALTEDGHAGQLYEVTGPQLLSFAEAIAEIAKAAGRQIDYQNVALQQYTAEMRAEGLAEECIAALIEVAGVVLDGRNASVTDGVQRALGREPRDFTTFARAAAAGVWTR